MYATFGTILGILDAPKGASIKASVLKESLRELDKTRHSELAFLSETAIALFEARPEKDEQLVVGDYAVTRNRTLSEARHSVTERIRTYIGQFISASRRDQNFLIFMRYYRMMFPLKSIPPHLRGRQLRRC